MTRAVFLDRDGVINEDTGYPHKLEDLVILPGVYEALQKLQKLGFRLFIISNQSGIGRGYYSFEDFERFNNEIIDRLEEFSIKIEETYICPHHPDDKCECRKPAIGNLKKAESDYDISLPDSYVIGDKQSDIDLGKKAGCYTVYITSNRKDHKPKGADCIANNILNAANWIESAEKRKNNPHHADSF